MRIRISRVNGSQPKTRRRIRRNSRVRYIKPFWASLITNMQKTLVIRPPRSLINWIAKSDLYIYFYFHGLYLLNPKGTFCFITSNSWLDVGYGKDLQEFTPQALSHQADYRQSGAAVLRLRRCEHSHLSFLRALMKNAESGLGQTARFVMPSKPRLRGFWMRSSSRRSRRQTNGVLHPNIASFRSRKGTFWRTGSDDTCSPERST